MDNLTNFLFTINSLFRCEEYVHPHAILGNFNRTDWTIIQCNKTALN